MFEVLDTVTILGIRDQYLSRNCGEAPTVCPQSRHKPGLGLALCVAELPPLPGSPAPTGRAKWPARRPRQAWPDLMATSQSFTREFLGNPLVPLKGSFKGDTARPLGLSKKRRSVDPPIIYTKGALEPRFGGSTIWILPGSGSGASDFRF